MLIERIQELMDLHALNATAFAEKLDIGRATISHILAGRNKPSLDFILKVISTFPEVTFDWLLFGQKKVGTLPPTNSHVEQKTEAISDDKIDQNTLENSSSNDGDKINNMSLPNSGKSTKGKSSIKRIVVFFDDGTFENYEM